jgi:hypothetical protein
VSTIVGSKEENLLDFFPFFVPSKRADVTQRWLSNMKPGNAPTFLNSDSQAIIFFSSLAVIVTKYSLFVCPSLPAFDSSSNLPTANCLQSSVLLYTLNYARTSVQEAMDPQDLVEATPMVNPRKFAAKNCMIFSKET